MPKLESLIVIEESLANKLGQAWQKYATPIMDEVVELVEAGKEAEAIFLVRTLTADKVVDDLEGAIEFLLTSALLLGASQWTDDINDTIFSKGDLPLALDVAIGTFILSAKKVADSVRDQALKVIAAYFDAQKEVTLKTDLDGACTLHDHDPIWKTQTFVLKAPSKLAQAMAASVLGTGKALFNAGANLATSRLVTYGGLSQASVQKDGRYQISEQLDDKICPVCETMHGKTFEVTIARDRMESILMMDNPDDLKAAAPWPSQTQQGIKDLQGMNEDTLVANRYQNPPYHPHCRGVVVRVGSVAPLPPSKLPKPRIIKPKPVKPALVPQIPPAVVPDLPSRYVAISNEALFSIDARAVAVQTKGIGSLDELFEQAAKADRHTINIVETYAERHGGKPVFPPSFEEVGNTLKTRESALEKLLGEYEGDVSLMADLSRGTIAFDNLDGLYAALDDIVANNTVVSVKDRFVNPTMGYRDIIMKIKVPGDHVVELQLNVEEIIEYKFGRGHALYEGSRKVQRAANESHRALTSAEAKLIDEMTLESVTGYDERYFAALQKSTGLEDVAGLLAGGPG